jgi:predicted GNAT family acetyltransferase
MTADSGHEGQGNDQTVTVLRDDGRHRYIAFVGDAVAGFLAYRDHDGVRDLLHTEVDGAFGGRGIGTALAQFALDDIRDGGGAMVPSCPFVRSWVRRHPDYIDLVRPADRDRLSLVADGER